MPAEVPSPQLMVALKALAGSTALAWVKVATTKFVTVWFFVLIAPETTIAGSANEVVALALLLAELGSGLLLVTDAVSLTLPSSTAWAVTEAVALPPEAMAPME